MLILNFRKDLFNRTARLIMEESTDVFPLTAYCGHPDCITDSYYTYRFYSVDARECPALYFDPLITRSYLIIRHAATATTSCPAKSIPL
jgi:thymidine kinase